MSIWMPCSTSAIFCFTSSTSAKHFSLRTVFIWGDKKKSHLWWDQVNRKGWVWGSCHFGQKMLNIQHGVGRCACKSPIMKWANALKESSKKKKNSLKPNAASHNNTSWDTDTDGFLEHSPSGGSLHYKVPALQKIIQVFWVPSCISMLDSLIFFSFFMIRYRFLSVVLCEHPHRLMRLEHWRTLELREPIHDDSVSGFSLGHI